MEEKKEYSIDDLLSMLQGNTNSEINNKLSPIEIWNMITNRVSCEKMGFADEEELKDWINDNPYSNLV